jgi:hypothetical protein
MGNFWSTAEIPLNPKINTLNGEKLLPKRPLRDRIASPVRDKPLSGTFETSGPPR